MSEVPKLRRALGTAALTLYGVGVIVGAGIYVLVGEVVAEAGAAAWLAFLGASLVALPTGLSYAELASRYPESAGEAVYAAKAFERPSLSFLVGFIVVASGVTSVAAVSHGFVDYLGLLLGHAALPRAGAVIGVLAVLSLVNFWGIREATWFNVICTVLSVGGLLALAVGSAPHWDQVPALLRAGPQVPPMVLLGTMALAFYAFIGFEDICNMADEVREPSTAIPRAILSSLAIATALYVVVTLAALAVVPAEQLAQSPTPLSLVWMRLWPGSWPGWLAIIALLAVLNTALFNLVMTSRVLYGMARRGWLPALLGRVHARTRTPWVAVLAAFALAVALALTGVLGVLARATNVIILLAFASVNLSLLVVRLRGTASRVPPSRIFRVPLMVPALGVATTVLMLTRLPGSAFSRAGVVIALGVVLHLVARWRLRSQARTRPDGPEESEPRR